MFFLLVDPCHGYLTFNATDRNLANVNQPHVPPCDSFPGTDWYRFQGAAGTRLPTQCPLIGSELPSYPVWLNVTENRLPRKGEDVKEGIIVCLPFDPDCCVHHFNIGVKNCSSYLVYRLHAIVKCPYRYYGTN